MDDMVIVAATRLYLRALGECKSSRYEVSSQDGGRAGRVSCFRLSADFAKPSFYSGNSSVHFRGRVIGTM